MKNSFANVPADLEKNQPKDEKEQSFRAEPLDKFLKSRKENARDILLIGKIAAGDEKAISELYDKHSGLLFSIVVKVLRNEIEAEDTLQEVFLRIWEKSDLYNETYGPPIVWMCRIARNLSIDKIRSKSYRQKSSESDIENHFELFDQEPTSQPEASAIQSEEHALIKKAMNTLSGDQKKLIEYAYFQGFSQSELAEHFNIPLGTVKTRIRSAMSVLKVELKELAF